MRSLTFAVVLLTLIVSRIGLCADSGFGVVSHPDNTTNIDPGVAIAGMSPFYPSRASTDGRRVTPEHFESTLLCSGCHMDIFNQWKGSMHSNSWTDPVYRAALNLMSQFSHGKIDNFCMGCHTPIGVVTHEASPGERI
jgi:hypothetical protein